MRDTSPANKFASLILDELLADPRAHQVLELARRANHLLDSLRPAAATNAAVEPDVRPAISARRLLLFGDGEALTAERVRQRRTALASLCHPDSGGDTSVMAALNAAADELLAELA